MSRKTNNNSTDGMMQRCIYIVSGWPRTFTSMMMGCLSAGGMECTRSKGRDMMRDRFTDEYEMNRGGVFELGPRGLQHFYNNPAEYEGKVVKITCQNGMRMPEWVGGYRVLFTLRHPEELIQSYEYTFSKMLMNDDGIYLKNIRRIYRGCPWPKMVMQPGKIIDARNTDFGLCVSYFDKIRDAGWPIDPVAAAEYVNPELYHFRLPELCVGVRL